MSEMHSSQLVQLDLVTPVCRAELLPGRRKNVSPSARPARLIALTNIPPTQSKTIQMNILFTLLLCMLSLAFAAEEQTFYLSKRSPGTPKEMSVPLYRRSGKGKRTQPPPPSGPPPAKRQKKSQPPPPTTPHPSVVAAKRIAQDVHPAIKLKLASLNGLAEGRGPGEPPASLAEDELDEPPRVIPTTDAEIAAEEQQMHGQRQYMEHVMAESDRRENELPVNQQRPYGEYGTQELFGENYDNPNNIRYDSAHRHDMAPEDTADLAGMVVEF
jgi:hypothetical protein